MNIEEIKELLVRFFAPMKYQFYEKLEKIQRFFFRKLEILAMRTMYVGWYLVRENYILLMDFAGYSFVIYCIFFTLSEWYRRGCGKMLEFMWKTLPIMLIVLLLLFVILI